MRCWRGPQKAAVRTITTLDGQCSVSLHTNPTASMTALQPFSFQRPDCRGKRQDTGLLCTVSAPSAGVPVLSYLVAVVKYTSSRYVSSSTARASTQKEQFWEKLGSVCHKVQLYKEIIGELKNDLIERQYVGQRVSRH